MARMYGHFPGGDPRKFEPDEELNTPQELASWKAACQAWDEGRTEQLPDCISLPGGILMLTSGFGLGVYEYDDEEPDDDELALEWVPLT